jgi:hypothetical protein
MRKFPIMSALAFVLVTAGSAMASDDESRNDAARGSRLTIAEITAKFAAQGYDVRQVKEEDGGYELYAVDKDGNRVESRVDPVTGALQKGENDD